MSRAAVLELENPINDHFPPSLIWQNFLMNSLPYYSIPFTSEELFRLYYIKVFKSLKSIVECYISK